MLHVDQKTGTVAVPNLLFSAALLGGFDPFAAWADGAPQAWGLGLQAPGSAIERHIYDFHDMLLIIICAVVMFVLALLIYVMLRFNRKAHPIPSTTTHNVGLEVIWTVIPCLIVAAIAWRSFPLLYDIDRMPPPDLTLKVTGHQWYWSYEYPDRHKINFDSLAIWNVPDAGDAQVADAIKDAEPHWLIHEPPQRLLEVDNRVVLPVGKVIRVQITGGDVLHSWYVPSVGINRMAVVGRLNEVWFKIDQPGLYRGQCSMICGTGHGYMPIVIEAVTPEQFEAWAGTQKVASR